MKKVLSIISALAITAGAYTLNLQKGWQLKGALEDINTLSLKKDGINSVWSYENGKWKAFVNIPIDLDKYGIEKLDKIKKGEGFWVNASKDVVIDTDKKEVAEKKWLKIDEINGVFYGVECRKEIQACFLGGLVKVDISNGTVSDPTTGEIWDKISKVDDYTLYDKEIDEDDEEIYYDRFVKVDNHIEIYKSNTKDGVYKKQDFLLFYSLDDAQNYVDEINKKEGITKVTDFSEIKGKVFYKLGISGDGKLSTEEFKVDSDSQITTYYAYNQLTTNLGHKDGTIDIKLKDGKFIYYDKDDKEWESQYVYKIPLKGKTYTINQLASEYVWDNDALKGYFTINKLPKTFNFTKGNMYCRMLWWECWFDKEAMEDLIDQITK